MSNYIVIVIIIYKKLLKLFIVLISVMIITMNPVCGAGTGSDSACPPSGPAGSLVAGSAHRKQTRLQI